MSAAAPRVLALSGGVGGAKLARGLARVLPPMSLTVICNNGDDFEHLGLRICPDLDSVVYALADLADRERGWGRAGESWEFMGALGALGAPTWFALGDRDLALHVWRNERLRRGETLTDITLDLTRRLGVPQRILPMCDTPAPTRLRTDQGELDFQDYFVRQRAQPRVTALHFPNSAGSTPPASTQRCAEQRHDAILLCPSNPYLSIDPILAIPYWRNLLTTARCPVVAVSPIVGGRALKGCAAKMLQEFGHEVSALSIARHYGDLLDGIIIDDQDAALRQVIEALGIECCTAQSVMHDDADRDALARATLHFARQLSLSRSS